MLLHVTSYVVAFTISYVFGIAHTYFLNVKWVFRTQPTLASGLRFPFVYVAQYFLTLPILWLLVDWFHVHKVLALLIAAVVVLPITFLLTRLAILRPDTKKT